jgi:RNase P subunit RPR2
MNVVENNFIKCRGCEKMLILNENELLEFFKTSENIINKICDNCNNEEKLVIRKAYFIVDYARED